MATDFAEGKGGDGKTVDLITGATSSIGVHLIKRLMEEGHEVRVLFREEKEEGDAWKKLPGGAIPYVADITLKRVTDRTNMVEACKGVDNLFHFAALTNLNRATLDDYTDVNVVGTENVLDAYMEANPGNKVLHFLFISSTAVYGKNRTGETITEDSELKPNEPYGTTKLMAEQVIRSFAEAHANMKYTIMRTGNMYGQGYDSSFNKVFKYIQEGRLKYIGSGSNHLTLVHVDDVVDAFMLALDNPKAYNRIYNLTDGVAYTSRQLFDKAAEFLRVSSPTKSVHPLLMRLAAHLLNINNAEVSFLMSDRVVSIDRIGRELGFRPKRSVDSEGKEMAEDFLRRQRA